MREGWKDCNEWTRGREREKVKEKKTLTNDREKEEEIKRGNQNLIGYIFTFLKWRKIKPSYPFLQSPK